jgi:hypothetical protein
MPRPFFNSTPREAFERTAVTLDAAGVTFTVAFSPVTVSEAVALPVG